MIYFRIINSLTDVHNLILENLFKLVKIVS
jgi:hypothetical protein